MNPNSFALQLICTFGTIKEKEPIVTKKNSSFERDVIENVRKHVESQKYRLTEHALDRLSERFFELRDVVYVLQHGCHEEEKTLFNNKTQCWNYAIRGKTTDGIEARVVVAFEKDMIIITAIRLTKGKR